MPWRQRDELDPEGPPWDPRGLAAMPRDRPVVVTAAAAALAAGIVVGALWLFGWLRAPGPASIDDAMPFIDQASFMAATDAAASSEIEPGRGDASSANAAPGDEPTGGAKPASDDQPSTVLGDDPAGGSATSGDPTTTGTSVPVSIVVHVAGAVRRPGLVTIDAGARVQDAIDAAGGPSATADIDRLNLATVLIDGQRLYVPALGEDDAAAPDVVVPSGPVSADLAAGSGATGSGSDAAPALIDVNTAGAAELETVPGIGPVTAQKIIAKREAIGGFDTIDDLLEVSGIGDARLASMRDYLRVGPS